MDESPIRQLTRHVEPLSPTDTVGKAVEVVRRSQTGAAPVVDGDAVVGMVSEADLLRVLPLSAPAGESDPVEWTRTAPVESVMTREVLLVPNWYSVPQTARLMDSRGQEAMALVDQKGAYLGMVCRRDLIDALQQTFRPVSVGGMATPLGVYLTTGNHRAGAGDLGLFLTGATLFLLMSLSHWLVFAGVWSADELFGNHWSETYLSPFLAATRGQPHLNWLLEVVRVLVFFLLIRAVPLAGYHAAEHQVVHTVEHGYRLDRDLVRGMPRPHPRCGTNLAAFMMLFFFLSSRFNSLVALMVTLPFWRFLGMQMQQYFTTRPASDRQLNNGIRAGAQILERYHRDAGYRAPWWRRLWHTGLLQVVGGSAFVWTLGQLLARHVDLAVFL